MTADSYIPLRSFQMNHLFWIKYNICNATSFWKSLCFSLGIYHSLQFFFFMVCKEKPIRIKKEPLFGCFLNIWKNLKYQWTSDLTENECMWIQMKRPSVGET